MVKFVYICNIYIYNIYIYIYIIYIYIYTYIIYIYISLLANSFRKTLRKRLFSFIIRMVILFAMYFQMWLFVSQYTLFFLRNAFFRSNHERNSVKNGVLRNFAKFTWKHLGQRLFLKLQALIETLAQVFFCEFCEISKNAFLTEHVCATVSVFFQPSLSDA